MFQGAIYKKHKEGKSRHRSSHPAEEMAILSVYQSKPKFSKKGRKDFCQETTYGLPRVDLAPMPS